MCVHSWALRLESAFRLSQNQENRFVTADDFCLNFADALERGLFYFAGCGLFPQKEIASMVEDYSRLGTSLQEILKTKEGIEQMEELIGQIYAFKKLNSE